MLGEQTLDFEAVRVGEPKEQTLQLANHGQYAIKYDFNMNKGQTRNLFTIEPMEGRLEPKEEKTISVTFLSQKEIKLTTTQDTSDIFLNIYEGDFNEKHQ